MSPAIGNEGEGSEREFVFNRLDHDDAERVLSGHVPEGDGALAELSALVAEIRSSTEARIPDFLAAAQIAAAAAAAGEGTPGVHVASRPRRGGALSGAAGRVLAGAAMTFVLFIGAAAAGWFPDPIQTAVAGAGETIGIRFPRPQTLHPVVDDSTTTTVFRDETPVAITTTLVTTTSTTSTTLVDDDDDADDSQTALAVLVGGHVWQGTSCSGYPVEIRYSVEPDGTLGLGSVSDAKAEADVESDQIDVEFSDGVSVQIDLEHDGDHWALDVEVDRGCGDEGDDDDDDTEDDDGEADAGGGAGDHDENDDEADEH